MDQTAAWLSVVMWLVLSHRCTFLSSFASAYAKSQMLLFVKILLQHRSYASTLSVAISPLSLSPLWFVLSASFTFLFLQLLDRIVCCFILRPFGHGLP